MANVTYNGHNISHTVGKFHYTENEKNLSISVDFLVKSSSSGGLETLCDTVREKLTEINKDFSMTFGGSSEFSLSHSSNTGYNARPTLEKVASEYSTETCRHYRWTCLIGLPFLQTGYNYRREASVNISYMPSRQRIVAFNVTYTAGSSYSATDNYIAYAKLWAATVLSSIGGTYELVSETPVYESENKIVSSNFTYKEVIAYQSESALNDTSFIDMQCSYSLSVAQSFGRQLIAGYPVMNPPITMSLVFSTTLDKDVVTTDASFDGVYTAKIRPWLIKHAQTVLNVTGYSSGGDSNYILQDEQKTYNIHSFTISGRLQIFCPKTTDAVTAYDEQIQISRDLGKKFRKLFNGKDHSYSMWNVGKSFVLNRVIIISRLSEQPPEPVEYDGFGFDVGTGTWIKTNSSSKLSSSSVGAVTSVTGLTSTIMYSKVFSESYIYVENNDEQAFIGS